MNAEERPSNASEIPPQLVQSLCLGCRYRRLIQSGKGAIFLMCQQGLKGDGWPKYPGQPVRSCNRFQPRDEEGTNQTERTD